MRNLSDVILEMKRKIPQTEESFHSILDDLQSSAIIASPEMIPFWWNEVATALHEEIGDSLPTSGWQLEIIKIWNPTIKA